MSRAGLLAKLASVAPPHGYTSWPQASGARLLDLTRPACERCEGNRGLVARLEEWGQGGKVELSELGSYSFMMRLLLRFSKPLIISRWTLFRLTRWSISRSWFLKLTS